MMQKCALTGCCKLFVRGRRQRYCSAACRNKAWRRSNPSAAKAATDSYRKRHAVEIARKMLKDREKNRAKRREQARKRYAANLNKEQKRQRDWRARNVEKVLARDKTWREENPVKVREMQKRSRVKRAEKIRKGERERGQKRRENRFMFEMANLAETLKGKPCQESAPTSTSPTRNSRSASAKSSAR